ncbi:MAG TPA: DegT/DnrJ/EryC1/StrS family aminotransferase [Candidatus Ratteibacteria bacterium]|nr:DegT/DnrJ/EryC1/StrS family aminotransferase [Candidatus Ratteibacteria bacterium]
MPGRELFGDEELKEVIDVMKRKVIFRYGFEKEREGIFKVVEFENEFSKFIGSKYSLGVSSGSSSLKVALESLNLPKGKEIITQCFTFSATIEAIRESGFIPVLCEIDKTLNMDVDDLKRKINNRTVAIMPVHMMGVPSRIEEICEIAKDRNLKVVEDNCQSTGALYKGKKLGTFGDIGCFSFDYVKVMTTGEGGMVVTDDEELYKQADYYHDHGHPHLPGVSRGEEKKMRDGFNFRMNELQGAIGIAQLKKLPEVIRRHKENKNKIKNGIKNLNGIEFREILDVDGDISTFLTMFLPDKEKAEKLKEKMRESGVAPATLNYWHFTANVEICGGNYPKSQELLERSVVLELKAIMSDEEIEKIIDVMKSF